MKGFHKLVSPSPQALGMEPGVSHVARSALWLIQIPGPLLVVVTILMEYPGAQASPSSLYS